MRASLRNSSSCPDYYVHSWHLPLIGTSSCCSASLFHITMFSLLPISLRALLAWNFWWADVDSWNTNATPSLRFQLRHQHAVSNTTRIVFSDMASSLVSDEYGVATQRVTSHRPLSFSAFSSARFRAMRHKQNDALLWQKTDVLGPNVTDRESLLTLAKMTGNAYTKPNAKDWYDLGSNWNAVGHLISTTSPHKLSVILLL